MSNRWVPQRRRLAQAAYSPYLGARAYRVWRRFADDPARKTDQPIADLLLLPLTGLTVTLILLGAVPGAIDAVAAAGLGWTP